MIESLVQDRGLNTIEVGELAFRLRKRVSKLKGKGRRAEREFSDPVQSHPSEKLLLQRS